MVECPQITKKLLKELDAKKHRAQCDLSALESEYKEYKRFFRIEDGPKAESEAEERFYSYMLNLLNVGPYEEGKYHLEHRSLEKRMSENSRQKRDLMKKIGDLKKQHKEVSKQHAANVVAFKTSWRQKIAEVVAEVEEVFQARGIELRTIDGKREYDFISKLSGFRITFTTEQHKCILTGHSTIWQAQCQLTNKNSYRCLMQQDDKLEKAIEIIKDR